jgi:hypothetical protein
MDIICLEPRATQIKNKLYEMEIKFQLIGFKKDGSAVCAKNISMSGTKQEIKHNKFLIDMAMQNPIIVGCDAPLGYGCTYEPW